MPPRRRLSPDQRRAELLDVGTRMFAERPYDEVQMDEIAERAGISRALLYRHFPSKRALFAAIYQRAADDLVAEVELAPGTPLPEQVAAGLEAHFDYFAANRNTVLAANRALAGDPTIQAIISGELASLRLRMLDTAGLTGESREVTAAILMAWLRFVHSLSLDWLEHETPTREQLRNTCIGALSGALSAVQGARTYQHGRSP
ncbi:TetR/AcrR family transcriptional regulator [Nocardia transvalensis]|uniref:TetR/AcrR family transcriptional regulator n=1 Tax=Nocardia transvalensis TaxID=37333 RepID=UPI0018960E82|nr:TetR/AcrR family transcriptional regulator [Nocardia transvalensis]MBF6327880.1 TetR/AcrR family transcriptional regulator [Nocardia transvalensis]